MSTPLERLIEKLVTQTAVADALGIKPQAVQQWEVIPEKWALDVERITGGEVTAAEVLAAAKERRQAKANAQQEAA